VRDKARCNVERYANEKGREQICVATVAEARTHFSKPKQFPTGPSKFPLVKDQTLSEAELDFEATLEQGRSLISETLDLAAKQGEQGPAKETVTASGGNAKVEEAVPPHFIWLDDAALELKKVPFFVRDKARCNVERYANEKGREQICVATVAEARTHFSKPKQFPSGPPKLPLVKDQTLSEAELDFEATMEQGLSLISEMMDLEAKQEEQAPAKEMVTASAAAVMPASSSSSTSTSTSNTTRRYKSLWRNIVGRKMKP
jgi:hypothetical protein